jgi:hypothetical protein
MHVPGLVAISGDECLISRRIASVKGLDHILAVDEVDRLFEVGLFNQRWVESKERSWNRSTGVQRGVKACTNDINQLLFVIEGAIRHTGKVL